jgi:hypothetical protein
MGKKRLTVNVDAELITAAKRRAREQGVTLSSLVEESLRELAGNGVAPDDADGIGDDEASSWVDRWAGFVRGKLTPPTGDDPRYEYLWYKYRLYESDDNDQRSPAEQEAAREAFLERWRSGPGAKPVSPASAQSASRSDP